MQIKAAQLNGSLGEVADTKEKRNRAVCVRQKWESDTKTHNDPEMGHRCCFPFRVNSLILFPAVPIMSPGWNPDRFGFGSGHYTTITGTNNYN